VRILSTPSSCWRTALAFVTATPGLLGHRPTRHPICETSVAIVRLRRRHTAAALIRTTLAVDSAAPLFLGHRPTCLPVCETISAIVRIGRWRDRLWRWHDDGLRRWHDDGLRRRCGWRAAFVVISAAPCLLIGGPSVLRINCTVEGIHWSTGCWRSGGWLSRRRSRRRSGRGCWKWCGWNGGSGLRESCGAAPAHR